MVELTIFSNTYVDNIWALSPLRKENNRQHVGDVEWEDYIFAEKPRAGRAAKIMRPQDHPGDEQLGGGIPGHSSPADVDAGQEEMARAYGRAEVIVAKQRHGSTGKVRLKFDSRITKFSDAVDEGYLPELRGG